jgi:hypothetical protein
MQTSTMTNESECMAKKKKNTQLVRPAGGMQAIIDDPHDQTQTLMSTVPYNTMQTFPG